MKDLKKYISKKMEADFRKRLPELRRQTAAIPIDQKRKTFGLGGNTFRAFTGWNNKPSIVYRQWAEAVTLEITSNHLKKVSRSRKAFLSWHDQLERSLQSHWRKIQGSHLSIAHCMKCVDAYVAWLTRHNFGDPSASVALEKVANCLLDKQVLLKLNQCYSNALPIGQAPSMGHITHRETYDFCQDLIGAFAEKVGGNRLLYDRFGYVKGNG